MIDNPFRTILPRFAGPLLQVYRICRLTPNTLTLLALTTAAAAAYATAQGWTAAALASWWGSRLLDGTDGIYARSTQRATPFGAYLDIVCDMAAYSFMVMGFAVRFPELALTWSAVLLMYVLCIASALALGSLEASLQRPAADNRGLRLGAGLAEGGETGLAYTAFLLWPTALPLLTQIWLLILLLTVLARTALARQVLRPSTAIKL